MVGIAGGVPHPNAPDKHVRLGDVVVSNEQGVFQWDSVKRTPEGDEHRDASPSPSASLFGRSRLLEAGRIEGKRPWESLVPRHRGFDRLKWREFGRVDRQLDAARLTGHSADQVAALELDDHSMDARRRHVKEGLHVVFGGWVTVEQGVRVDEGEVLALLLRETRR
jgi:hypothetical protein